MPTLWPLATGATEDKPPLASACKGALRGGKKVYITAALSVFLAFCGQPANSQSQRAFTIVTLETLGDMCSRDSNGNRRDVCSSYLLGHMDAAVSIAEFSKNAPQFCVDTDSLPALIDRIISYIPTTLPGDEQAAVYVQAAISRALACLISADSHTPADE